MNKKEWTTNKTLNKIIELSKVTKFFELIEVDFNKSVWNIALQQKFKIIGILLLDSLIPVSLTVAPYVFSVIFKERSFTGLFGFLGVYYSIAILTYLSFYSYIILTVNTTNSVRFSANKNFLTTDPINHSTRSSGQILSKTARGSDTYEKVMDIFIFSFFYISISLISTFFIILQYELYLAIISFLIIFLTIIFSLITSYFINKFIIPHLIKAEDDFKACEVETLAQVAHIRSTFASDSQLHKLQNLLERKSAVTSGLWLVGVFFEKLIRVFYFSGIIFLSYVLLNKIQEGSITEVESLAIISVLSAGSNSIIRFGKDLQKFFEGQSKIQDLYTFIQGFGNQTYPVLKDDKIKN